ncbi:hypothetical protein M2322_004421 [Rhodoblastus acidophilus]|nr:hypothetical protein [Rhodoblastus acidophilus]
MGLCFALEAGLDHFEHAGLSSTPVTMDAHSYWLIWSIAQEFNYGCRDRLIVEEINLGFIVRQDHQLPLSKSRR